MDEKQFKILTEQMKEVIKHLGEIERHVRQLKMKTVNQSNVTYDDWIKNEFSFYQPEAYTKNPNRTPHAVKIPSLTKKLIASDGYLAGIVM